MNIDAEMCHKAMADLTRLRLLALLDREEELCVCELTHALGLAQPKVSRHLAILRDAGLVLDHRQGLWIYYRVNPDLPAWVHSVIHSTAEGVGASEPFASDRTALGQMPNRPGARCCA